jgi:hypothetical protein
LNAYEDYKAIELLEERGQWRSFVAKAMNLNIPEKKDLL